MHTQGPWVAEECEQCPERGRIYIHAKGWLDPNELIAETIKTDRDVNEGTTEEAEANAELIVRAVNAHATLVAALENARSIVRAFTGDLLAVPKSQSDAGYVDSVAWTVQQEIEAALHLAKHGSSQVEQPQ